jgi:hypothetical protein
MPKPISSFVDLSGRARVATVLFALAGAVACAAKPAATPAPAAPAPVAAATPTWMSCPDPTDGPSIVINAVDEAHRAFIANPSTQLPPACVFGAFARVAATVTDSVNDRALALAAEARKRGPESRELLSAEVVLLARGRRFTEVSRTYDRLVALDSQPAMEVSRLAIAAARQRGDTASLLRLLSRTMSRPGASPALRTEYNVVRQAGQLWGAITEARGLLRQNPRYVAAYPSFVGNFGTLGLADSVAATTRRAIAAGAARTTISPSLETLVSAMLRHAALYGSTYGWDAVIGGATRVDSALTSPSTKFLVAALIIHAAEPRTTEIAALVGSPGMSRSTDASAERRRASGCQRIPALTASLNTAEAKLREGGDRYPGGGVSQFQAGLSAAREKIAALQNVCTQSGT